MRDVTNLIRAYCVYLDRSWMPVCELRNMSDEESILENWLEASWEMLVEGSLGGVVLPAYYGGAELNPRSDRVHLPQGGENATHVVVCRSDGPVLDMLTQRSIALPSDGIPITNFVTMIDGMASQSPPFDCVRIESPEHVVVFRIESLLFCIRPIQESDYP